MALAKMTWDELNRLVGYKISEPFDEYYEPMRITEEQKRKRIELAERLDEVFIALLAEMFYAEQLGIIVNSDIYDRTRDSYLEAISESIEPDETLFDHAVELIYATLEVLSRHKDEEWFYSEDRARAISEGDSNYLWAYEEYGEAIDGNAQYKTWLTIMDGRERDSHAEVNGITIPIDEPFELQGGMMLFPGDDSLGASDDEIVNCRCSLEFS